MTKKIVNIVAMITAVGMDEAENVAGRLLSEKKAACVNIIPGVESRYWWKGKIESAKEYLLIVKSSSDMLEGIIRIVKEIHSYEVPEIIALSIMGGSADYLKWMQEELRGGEVFV